MTENEPTPETEAPAPVRVPNVSHGAISGLDHEVIGAAAIEAHEAQLTAPEPGDDTVPEGDLDSRVAWVSEPDEQPERAHRADLVYEHEKDADDGTDLDALAARLRDAVYGTTEAPRVEGTQAGADPESSLTGTGAPVGRAPDAGDPTNGALPGIDAVQGEHVAQPGDQLPTVEQDGGTPLAPPIPEDVTSVDALLDWIGEADSDDENRARAQLVMDTEMEKPEDDRRSTLIAPVQKLLETPSE